MGYSFIIPQLAQGSKPESRMRLPFHTVVLCAVEHQDIELPGIEVIHAPFDDGGQPPTPAEVQIAWTAAKRVARRVKVGRRVLVTCAKGWNRSGLVSAMALMMLGLQADAAIHVVRLARGPNALSNRDFVVLLRSIRPAPLRGTDSDMRV